MAKTISELMLAALIADPEDQEDAINAAADAMINKKLGIK